MDAPQLYVIAGCNGAGETTASFTVLPDVLHCGEFVNADEIARGLSPFRPEKVAIEAVRLMIGRVRGADPRWRDLRPGNNAFLPDALQHDSGSAKAGLPNDPPLFFGWNRWTWQSNA